MRLEGGRRGGADDGDDPGAGVEVDLGHALEHPQDGGEAVAGAQAARPGGGHAEVAQRAPVGGEPGVLAPVPRREGDARGGRGFGGAGAGAGAATAR